MISMLAQSRKEPNLPQLLDRPRMTLLGLYLKPKFVCILTAMLGHRRARSELFPDFRLQRSPRRRRACRVGPHTRCQRQDTPPTSLGARDNRRGAFDRRRIIGLDALGASEHAVNDPVEVACK